jgi:predicted small lipoprotein YifL
MMQRRHWLVVAAAVAALVACGRKVPKPPPGEIRSALVAPTLAGDTFDPATLGDKLTLVTFWSPS